MRGQLAGVFDLQQMEERGQVRTPGSPSSRPAAHTQEEFPAALAFPREADPRTPPPDQVLLPRRRRGTWRAQRHGRHGAKVAREKEETSNSPVTIFGRSSRQSR